MAFCCAAFGFHVFNQTKQVHLRTNKKPSQIRRRDVSRSKMKVLLSANWNQIFCGLSAQLWNRKYLNSIGIWGPSNDQICFKFVIFSQCGTARKLHNVIASWPSAVTGPEFTYLFSSCRVYSRPFDVCVFVCEIRLERVVNQRGESSPTCCLFWFDYGLSGVLCRGLDNKVIWHSFLIVQVCMNKALCIDRKNEIKCCGGFVFA